jgi:hydrogenase nickel incorporation protein HypA/HybF
MHEHALMADLVGRILKTAAGEGGRRVTAVSVWLGALSHMTPDHFADHFEQATAGTIAEGATVSAVASTDIDDPRAADVVLTAVEVET